MIVSHFTHKEVCWYAHEIIGSTYNYPKWMWRIALGLGIVGGTSRAIAAIVFIAFYLEAVSPATLADGGCSFRQYL
jgi:hypothetical protein